ncbi:MAG: type IX secretion system membrane protein PorP/SprF [Bacteroidetes bacterium]|nr:type IX secretion system membrane protein PorP/SprF [Bacteroidota bacterium]
MKHFNTRIKTLLLIAVCGVSGLSNAQQIPLYSQFYFNKFLYNPAYTGYNKNLEAYIFGRRQYTHTDGYQTSGITLNGSANDGRMGLGLYFINDVNQIMRNNSVYGNYAYHLKLNEDVQLSFGFALGVVKTQFNLNNIIVTDPNDPVLRLLARPKGAALDASIGANLKAKGFNLGFSVPQFLQPGLDFTDNYSSETTFTHKLQRHLTVMASYDIWANDNLKIQPLLLIKNTKNAPGQLDINVTADWKESGWLGFGIRTGYGVSFMGGLKITENLRVGYSYDASTGQYSTALGGSHEFLIGAVLGGKKEEKKPDNSEDIEALKTTVANNEKQKREQNKRIMDLENEVDALKTRPATKDTVYVVSKQPASQPGNNQPQPNTNPTKPNKQPSTPNNAPVKGDFIVVAGSFSQEANATIYFNQLVNKGYSPYVYFDRGNGTYYVHVGKFTDKEKAKEYAKDHSNREIRLWVKTL